MVKELKNKKENNINLLIITFIITINIYLCLSAFILIFQNKINNIDISRNNILTMCSDNTKTSLCFVIPVLNMIPEKYDTETYIKIKI